MHLVAGCTSGATVIIIPQLPAVNIARYGSALNIYFVLRLIFTPTITSNYITSYHCASVNGHRIIRNNRRAVRIPCADYETGHLRRSCDSYAVSACNRIT